MSAIKIGAYYLTKNNPRELLRLLAEKQDKIDEYKEVIDKLKEWIYIVQQNKDNKHLEPIISTDELDELLDILKEVK